MRNLWYSRLLEGLIFFVEILQRLKAQWNASPAPSRIASKNQSAAASLQSNEGPFTAAAIITGVVRAMNGPGED